MGSEGPHGGRRLRKRGGRVGRGGHGVDDPVPDGPMPPPPGAGYCPPERICSMRLSPAAASALPGSSCLAMVHSSRALS
jgi:hypothetical protein